MGAKEYADAYEKERDGFLRDAIGEGIRDWIRMDATTGLKMMMNGPAYDTLLERIFVSVKDR